MTPNPDPTAIPHGAEMECPTCGAQCHHDRDTPEGVWVADDACWWNDIEKHWECTQCAYK